MLCFLIGSPHEPHGERRAIGVASCFATGLVGTAGVSGAKLSSGMQPPVVIGVAGLVEISVIDPLTRRINGAARSQQATNAKITRPKAQ